MHLLICKRHGLLCIYNKKTIVVKPSICNTTMVLAGKVHLPKHTYLAQGTPWSSRRFPSSETLSLHFDWVDLDDHPKCGWLGCVIFVSGGLRSRYPLIKKKKKKSQIQLTTGELDLTKAFLLLGPVSLVGNLLFEGNLLLLFCFKHFTICNNHMKKLTHQPHASINNAKLKC